MTKRTIQKETISEREGENRSPPGDTKGAADPE